MMSIRKQYNDIAGIYDLLSEGDDGLLYFRMNAGHFLKKLPAGAAVLDCSCGTGDHAIWLARQHFQVYASDISEGMLDRAREKAAGADASIRFFRASWDELASRTPRSYPLIMSPGNSFSHLSGMEMLDSSLSGIFPALEEGGTFIFDIRNWEKTFSENNLEPQEFEAGKRGSRMRVRYSWDIKGWNTLCTMIVDTQDKGQHDIKTFYFDFFPLSFVQLEKALAKAGFTGIERRFYPDDNYYFVSAKK